ncbi:hypothetical protein SETIT_7G063300v2 [Setaria italica]|uniref:Homeobox domain-containing protein n=1 Tax=Setaria italica TaxID=4555 RepID=A0A368RST4_SETIT|nr:hypothetical protein SETIT_7G063300v2 [Setaria italica]
MENEGQMNNNGQGIGLNSGNETAPLHRINQHEYDINAPKGAEDHLNTDRDEDDEEQSSEHQKCFTAEQIQELEFWFQECALPDDEMNQDLATKVGLEARHVKAWFQNRRSQMKKKAVGGENKYIQQQNDKLLAENKKLKQQLQPQSCGRCGDPTNEKWRLLIENARLNHTYLCAQENLIKLVHNANLSPSETMEHLASASLNLVPFAYNGRTDQAFLMLAVKGEPMWLPTMNGEILNEQEYKRHMFPGLLGPCPQGFVMEATKEANIVRARASGISHWTLMFPGIIEGVRASKVLSSGTSTSRDGLIQEVRVKSLRITRQIKNMWAVVDLSIDGMRGILPGGKRIGYTSCRHQISHALFQVLWIVHAEYDDTAVPPLFRQLFQSGQALGAIRWLTSLQRQCEYMAILRSSQVPSSVVSGVAMSMLGRRSILALAQRMMASFYTAVSEPITLKPGNIVKEWRGSCGTATELSEATVRMVLSATMTVWLPGTPPQRVHEYLCNEQRRGEWDTFANTGAVQELTSVITHPYLRGNNVVSVLEARDVPDQTNSNMLIMQEATSDVSCSLLVYSSIERNLIHAVMNGGDNTSIYLLPSGFAILPDGHGKTHRAAAASSSSAPTGHNGTAGSLLTAAYQALLPNNPSNHEAGTFNNAGNRVCNAINQILAAIGADIAVPS